MPVVGSYRNDVYVEELRYIVRRTALLMPFLVLIYGLAIRQSWLERSAFYSDWALAGITGGLILLSLWQKYDKANWDNDRRIAFNAVLYHLLAAAFLLFVSGADNPAVLFWMIMLICTDLFFGRTAYLLSGLLLVATAGLALAMDPSMLSDGRAVNAAGLIGIMLAVSWVASRMRQVGENERRAYHRLRQHEAMQRDRLQTLINGMAEAVIGTDHKGIIRTYNAATLGLLDTNRSLGGLKIGNALKLTDEQGQPVSFDALLKSARGVINRSDLTLLLESGEQIKLAATITPLRPVYQHRQIMSGYIIVLRDVTREKSLDEERDEFISVVSHELRTPVAVTEGLLSNLTLLIDRGVSPRQVAQSVNEAHEQVLFLAKMVNDLSTLSRAERGVADDPEEIDVSQLLHEIYQEQLPAAKAKNLALNLDLAPRLGRVLASRLYLSEILQNLVSNAIKYTNEGSVTIAAQLEGDRLRLSVSDTGIGISKSDQKHIFEKFFRSEDYRTRETSGTGLGLYVVSKLSRKLGISVSLTSRLNHGSSFSFSLPAIQAAKTKKTFSAQAA
ncbi:MAG: hypothetical protein EOT04_02140 [Candidatus Chaera renei]|uniref:histidine kinase n=1 Tax=Candidatus Chaera renei TaxID=2506947 RepID=A0A4Q0AIM7_9BACT|nr:MAG: hypothetical protein EOT04_02140 [Candidatus Chaera renei]